MDLEDSLAVKRRKTESNDEQDEGDGDVMLEETEITEDTDTFLQEFLSRRPQNNLSMFQRVVQDEEAEGKERDPVQDLKLYRDACADLSDCLADIADLKATKPDGWKEGVNDIRKEAAFITLIMKKLNRVEKTRTKASREKVSKEKQVVDLARVNLDNMLSEIQHLRREVEKCLKFRSRPLGIDLVPVNEFFEKAPTKISKPEITKTSDHELQLARLEWELKQRKDLSALLNDLESKRSTITEQMDKKEKDLTSIGPLVNNVLTASLPLKERLGSSSIETSKITDQAYLLPDPLYFLFVQASAYKDVSDKDVTLDIKGNFLEAQKFKNRCSDTLGDSSKVEVSKETSQKKSGEDKSKLFIRHPLSVILKFSMKDGFQFDFQFFYFINLNIGTVKSCVTAPPGLKVPASFDVLLNSKNFLHNLFSGDSGLESPNLMNYYQMQKVGLEALPLEKMGLPYIWVQKVVGLNFIGQAHKVDPKQEVCRTNLPVLMKELKRRCHHRISLLSLVGDLEGGDVMAPGNMKEVKVSARLSHLKGLSWSEYREDPLSETLRNSPTVTPHDIFFKALVSRGEAKLTCLIAVKPDYPLSPCVFSLGIDYGPLNSDDQAKKYSSDIECEANVFWKELLTSRTQAIYLLSYQLFKVMTCFDIVLETVCPEEFPPSREIESSFRGRTRALPLRYLSEENLFVHRT